VGKGLGGKFKKIPKKTVDKPATAPRKKCPRGKEKKNYVYVEKTSYHKGKNWIKGEKLE
jgi:hypothetical protein